MGAQRASWMAAFAAEDAARSGEHYAQSLLDLVKAFEMIPHHHIVLAAKKHGYPLWLLRLSEIMFWPCPKEAETYYSLSFRGGLHRCIGMCFGRCFG